MESNWRWNVWDLGLWGGPYTLIARLNAPTFYPTYLAQSTVPGFWFQFVITAPGQLPSNVIGVASFPSFPGGYPVFPD